MIIVIGSGPSAIAATHALTQQGHHVTILDVGTSLDSHRQEVVARMSRQEPAEWTKEDLETISSRKLTTNEAVHSKLSYGSSYSFDSRSSAIDVRWKNNTGFNHSLALGGLSNIWGASLLPYRQEDIDGWPITVADLQPHYRAVMDFLPGTGIIDGLEEILPLYTTTHRHQLQPSRQGQALLNDLDSRTEDLHRSGIFFGRSRLAIRASGDETHRECARCALCLSGCPYGLIYSSGQTVSDLIQSGRVTYFQDHLVEKFEQTGTEVLVTGKSLVTNESFSKRAVRVFVAAGVLPTAKIVLNSIAAFDTSITLVDSQSFIYPLLRFDNTHGVETEKMHTSSQVFLEIDDHHVSDHLVHLQIYGYSSFLHHELKLTLLGWPLRFSQFRRQFLGRLLVAQGFIHSKESGSVELTLKQSDDKSVYLDARVIKSGRALATTLKVGWKLMRQALNLRAIPLLPGLKFPNPGSGYHSGGTFPMREKPQSLETDILGRLPSMDRVHLVDASVLPSIPATSITLSIMANAHRIASIAGQLDSS